MRVDEEGMKFLQETAKLRSDPLGQDNRDPGVNPDNFNVGNPPQAREQIFKDVIGKQQRVPARKNHIADGRGLFDILQNNII